MQAFLAEEHMVPTKLGDKTMESLPGMDRDDIPQWVHEKEQYHKRWVQAMRGKLKRITL